MSQHATFAMVNYSPISANYGKIRAQDIPLRKSTRLTQFAIKEESTQFNQFTIKEESTQFNFRRKHPSKQVKHQERERALGERERASGEREQRKKGA